LTFLASEKLLEFSHNFELLIAKGEHMASKEKNVREGQKTYWERKLSQRIEVLTGDGLETDMIDKDIAVKKLRAKIRETLHRLRTIESKEKKIEEMARVKEEKKAAPLKEKSKKEKASEKPPADAKAKKKKKEEKPSVEAKEAAPKDEAKAEPAKEAEKEVKEAKKAPKAEKAKKKPAKAEEEKKDEQADAAPETPEEA